MALSTHGRLSRIQGRNTLYELVITDGATTYLVGYARKSRPGLNRAIRRNAQIVNDHFGPCIAYAPKAADGAAILEGMGETYESGIWRIKWSGRTEREAIASEHPFIGDLS